MRTLRSFCKTAAGLILGGVMAGPAIAQSPVIVDGGAVAAAGEVVVDGGVVNGGVVGGAVAPYNTYGGHDLFYNYYTQGYANQAHARAYVSPVPVPPNVGHTFFTYQPLYPDEMLYWHSHRYHNYYDNGRGLNRTSVHYYGPPVRTGVNYVWRKIQLPRP